MMVEYDDVHSETPRLGERLETGGSAIDRHQQRRATRRQRADRLAIGAIAFGDAVGNMDVAGHAAIVEEFRQQRRGTGAVDIVIAENRDGFVFLDRPDQPFGGFPHGGEAERLRQEGAQGRIEMPFRRFRSDSAPRQHA